MIFVVSGYPRSGTTALMRACAAGGLPVVTNHQRTMAVHWRDADGYRMNPGDVYEPTAADRARPAWPRQYDGKVVKVVAQWVDQVAVHSYRVAFLVRDLEEIRQSYEAAFGRRLSVDEIKFVRDEALKSWRNRRDTTVHIIQHRDLMVDPSRALTELKWGLDVERAAAAINPAYWRFRAEQLAVGA